jgi:hypothetical protein
MSIAQLLNFLSLLRPILTSVWRKVLPRLRQLNEPLLRLIWRIQSSIDLRRPPANPGKDQDEMEGQRERISLTSLLSLSPYTAVLDGTIMPLNGAAFSINPRSAGDSFRNSSTVLSLADRRQGSQLSRTLSSGSRISSRSPVPTPSASAASSMMSLPLFEPDLQETPNVLHDGQVLQIPPERQESSPPGINVTSSVSLINETAPADLIEYGLIPAIPSETLRYKKRKKMSVSNNFSFISYSCAAAREKKQILLCRRRTAILSNSSEV